MDIKWIVWCVVIASCRAVQFEESANDLENNARDFGYTLRGPDPFLQSINGKCENGAWAECFKSEALDRVNSIFEDHTYTLTKDVHVVQIPQVEMRSLESEPYEFSSEPRILDSEWEQFQKFLLRKMELFVKSKAFEIEIPENISLDGRYSPRFIDEISGEIDVLEDKKAPLFNKHRIKKLFIPMLIILKLFKLKLLLFLPFLLGLAGFKKLLGIAAFIIPGIIGYFKFCKPNTSPFSNEHSFYDGYSPQYSQYSSQGVGSASYGSSNPQYSNYPNYGYQSHTQSPYSFYARNNNAQAAGSNSNAVKFDSSDSSIPTA